MVAQNQNWKAVDRLVRHLCHEEMQDMGDKELHQLQERKWCFADEKNLTITNIRNYENIIIPVMRLFGSKTSIFSSRSTAPGDMFGNLREKFCFGYWGSCLTYLLALSLRRNPRLESSGEPISFLWRTKSIKLYFKGKARTCPPIIT